MKEPRKDIAVALRYDGDGAPRVTAKGEDHVAREILRIAREHEVPLKEDAQLARLASRVPLGDEIPAALYVAVAQVLVFAYRLSGKDPSAPGRR